MRILIVHNPYAGFGSDAIFEFERALLASGDECVMRILTSDPTDDGCCIADVESFDLVVLSGGDGTVSRLLYAVRGRKVPICLFPSGTANLIYHNIGNAEEPAALAAACRAARHAFLDLGEISWSSEGSECVSGFALMAGMGLDAQLMRDAIPGKQFLGDAAYFAAAITNLIPPVYTFTIEVDGEVHELKGISCVVANSSTIQGDIEIVPGCSMDDGMLDVFVLETTATLQLLVPIFAGIVDPTGRDVARPHISTFRGEHIRVTSDQAAPMEIDGDVVPEKVMGMEARVLPQSAQIVIDGLSRYAD